MLWGVVFTNFDSTADQPKTQREEKLFVVAKLSVSFYGLH